MKIVERAPAKLTLTLRMLDKRDDGFNNLEALTVFLPGLADTLETRDAKEGDPLLSISQSNGSRSRLDTGKTNLVTRAVKIYSEDVRVRDIIKNSAPLGFQLTKAIPTAAGLGGGSADAGATLRVMNRECDDILSISELCDIGAELGSDIPACVYSRALWMRGRGEVIEPLNDFPSELAALIVTPKISCPTQPVFARYEEMGRPIDEGIQAPQLLQFLTPTLHNDLALAAYDLLPDLVAFRSQLERVSDAKWVMAGSGSTFFTVGNLKQLEEIVRHIDTSLDREKISCIQLSTMT